MYLAHTTDPPRWRASLSAEAPAADPASSIAQICDHPRLHRFVTVCHLTPPPETTQADETVVRADLVTFVLGTGARIGESLAVLWFQVDLDAAIVDISHTIARVEGTGLTREEVARTLDWPKNRIQPIESAVPALQPSGLAADRSPGGLPYRADGAGS
ncbi:hypothetical protein [Kribbella sp. CA-293567]|uniref:hypothetical protein n=1 Tax=Kribbella sp. CA-293567 TaxID=3002436 RepID=UPI0022DE7327|nr:hypothetical protein [Kribbella sp. CA-293567]WBQ03376.1 hypothetical protein OX958_25790 [Kribbella sp. CA-293567]